MDREADAHRLRVAEAAAQLRQSAAGVLALEKATSNLFRDRQGVGRHRIDLRAFDQVLGSNPQQGWVDVEGMCTYEELTAWCLRRGVMPAVVPQLKTITVGGAAAGVGIEATSFRHGLVHHTLQEVEVLLPHGEVVVCAPRGPHADLYWGFPNSYGSLGYALRLRVKTQPVLPDVHVRHASHATPRAFFEALHAACSGPADFVDGVVFGPDEHVLNTATFVQRAPWRSDYGYERIYWQSLRTRQEDYLATGDYLWRWDTDWFWCSSNFGAQHMVVRRLLGRERLGSRTWQRWMRTASRWGLAQRWASLRGRYRESVIQDVDIPLDRAPDFLAFLHRETGILPVWVCPVRGDRPGESYPLYPLHAARMYVNFGFWSAVEAPRGREPGFFNRRIEAEVQRLGGIKSLYSDSYFTREAFARSYGMDQYERLKAKYDPQQRAPHLYDKCVRRQ